MASIKISELDELTEADELDILPIVDNSANETKKITIANVLKNDYSLNEVATNMKWIDGKKIYRKVINTKTLAGEVDYKEIAHGISNLDKVISLKCIANNGDNVFFDFNNYQAPAVSQIHTFVNATDIVVYNGGTIYVSDAYFILEYTKTS